MKDDNTPKLEGIKGRKSVCHYDDDGNITHIEIAKSIREYREKHSNERLDPNDPYLLDLPEFLRPKE